MTERLDLQAYVREQEAGFGVGQQLSHRDRHAQSRHRRAQRAHASAGRRAAKRSSRRTSQTGADRELVSAEARRETDDATASVGVKRVVDDLPQSGVQRSELMSLGGSLDVLRDRVTLRALTEQSLGSPGREPRLPRAHGARPRLSPLGRDDVVRRGRGCRRRADRLDDDARRRAQHAVVGLAAIVEREPRVQRVRAARVRERRSHAELQGRRGLGDGRRRRPQRYADGRHRGTLQPERAARIRVRSSETSSRPTSARSTAPTSGRSRRASSGATPTLAERWSFTSGFFREPIEGRALSVTTRWLDNDTALGAGRTVDAQRLVRLSAARQPPHRARAARPRRRTSASSPLRASRRRASSTTSIFTGSSTTASSSARRSAPAT